MHDRLKNWDQRVNRRMLGSAYRRKPPERVLWMAFLEKPKSNPHWHLVLQLTEEQNAREDIVAERSFSPPLPPSHGGS
ncbi:MAG: hypothetical protein ACU0A8_01460 [Limimaricola soesokkakensis]|uniref:hypothetical protein n=1 Tax=Limimaricola soesokkakensis TaxID=1343159 RepID=UPI004059AABA